MRIAVGLSLAAALPFCLAQAPVPGAQPRVVDARTAQKRPSAADSARRLVAVIYLRRDEIAGATRAELHPLAAIEDGEFHDATWPAIEGGERKTPLSILPAGHRRFTLYEGGLEVGRMTVDSIAAASYACLELPVGLGPLERKTPSGAWRETDPRVDRYRSWTEKGPEDYSLRYFVALSESVPQHDYSADGATVAAERLRDAIARLGRDTLQRFDLSDLRAEKRGQTEPRLEEFELFDLDRDGRPEGVGRLAMEVSVHFDYYEADATDEYRVTAVVWMRDAGPVGSPELLALQVDVQAPDSWGDGWELVEVLDLTGDGRAEVVYEWSGYESNSFHIFSLTDGRLLQSFGGGGHGC